MNAPCHDMRSLLDRFIDGDLSRTEKARVKTHLKACAGCRHALIKEREMATLLSDLPELSCPESVVRRIESRTFGKERKEKSYGKVWHFHASLNWQTVSVGLVGVALVALFVIHPLTNRGPSAPFQYSKDEAIQVANQAKWSLAYLAKSVNKAERQVVENVLLKDLPKAVRKSIKNAVPLIGGGQ